MALILSSHAFSQTISGFVSDADTGEKLPNVNLKVISSGLIAVTNNYGYFSLNVRNDSVSVAFTMVGYETKTMTFDEIQFGELQFIELKPSGNYLEEIKVVPTEKKSIKYSPLGLISLSVERLKNIPTLFGEKDVLKALTLLPGITNTTEGSSGILVRGGSPDQNLILLDETPIYNVTHLFGFVSVFNPDAIKDIKLYKAGFPARYGGRLSSVIDITSKEGSSKKKNREFTVGLINSRILLEGPLKAKGKNFGTFLAAGRLTNLSLLLLPTLISYHSNGGQYFNYNLYDINLKWNKSFKDNSQLLFNMYTGNDIWYVKSNNGKSYEKYKIEWGNLTSSLRYLRPISQKIFFKNTLAHTRYSYGITSSLIEKGSNQSSSYIDSKSYLNDILLKSSIELYPNSASEIFIGGELINHHYLPVNINSSSNLEVADNFQKIGAFEKGAFVEINLRPTPWLAIYSGFRGAFFNVQDTNYVSPEPRLSLSLILNNTAFKIGYSKMGQFLHLLNSSSGGLPNDLWIPASRNLPFETSIQKSMAITHDFGKMFSSEIAAYYKTYSNLVDYGIGQNFIINSESNYEKNIERNGVGKSYGLEFLLDKKYGELTGWISYTYSKNLRKFSGINEGEWYFANYDRRHAINITGAYKINEKVALSSNWVFFTGTPITVPIGTTSSFIVSGDRYPRYIYEKRNNFRTPNYHRLDVNASFTKITRRKNERILSLGVYNLYNHNNSFFLKTSFQPIFNEKRSDFTGWDIKTTKNNFIPFLPYISYSIKFK